VVRRRRRGWNYLFCLAVSLRAGSVTARRIGSSNQRRATPKGDEDFQVDPVIAEDGTDLYAFSRHHRRYSQLPPSGGRKKWSSVYLPPGLEGVELSSKGIFAHPVPHGFPYRADWRPTAGPPLIATLATAALRRRHESTFFATAGNLRVVLGILLQAVPPLLIYRYYQLHPPTGEAAGWAGIAIPWIRRRRHNSPWELWQVLTFFRCLTDPAHR